MERLIEKKENGRFSYYVPIAENITVKIENKLGKFEDFMEEQGFEDLQDLERYIEQSIKASELLDKKMKENQALKDRWEVLKDFIEEHLQYDKEELSTEKNLPNRFYIMAEEMILDKMKELEFADLIRRKGE